MGNTKISFKLNKPFKITSICRADLIGDNIGYTEDQVLKITDYQMAQIARRMADTYVENSFWIDAKIITPFITEIEPNLSE